MKPSDFQRFVEQIGQLSHRQREKLAALLQAFDGQGKVVRLLEQSLKATLCCPQCRATKLHRHGRVDGLQRYRCVNCARTFNSLTGTPLAHLRYKSQWLDYAKCLLSATTVRRAAARLGVGKNTTFRWRHRFLTLPKADRPTRLQGITEADEMYLLESEKGARDLKRPARKRGGAASQRGTSLEQVCILVARDRAGQTVDFVTGRGPVSKAALKRCLLPILDEDVLLVSDSNAAYHYFAREVGLSHQAINLKAKVRVKGAVHVQNVNAYHSRFRLWLSRFHGVATHYLPNYLGWRWALDKDRIHTPEAILSSAVGDFPHLAGT